MEKTMMFALLALISIFGAAGYFIYKDTPKSRKLVKSLLKLNLFIFIPVIAFGVITLVPEFTHAAAATNTTAGSGLGFIAAGLSTGLASLGAGVAVSSVGSAAIGAVSEDPKILGRTMIFLGLAEGIAIYGLIISIMILGKL